MEPTTTSDAACAPIPLRPRSGPHVAASAPRSEGSAAHASATAEALIVDDCRFIAERLARVLAARGYTCTVASNGYEGLEQLRARRFELVVIDVDMPFVDGFTLLRHLRHDPIHAHAPVLMLAADPSDADHERARSLGANACLDKPLQLPSLTATLEQIL